MKTIEKDILTVESGYILHQVNAQGIMRSGVAKAIREKYPKVFTEYKRYCDEVTAETGRWALMGDCQIIEINEDLSVVNLFGQYDFRKNDQDKQRYTEYGSFHWALHEFDRITSFERLVKCPHVYFPERVGSDRGGADWNIIQSIIQEIIPDAIICKLPK